MSRVLVELITFSQQTEKLLETRFNAKGRGLREKLDSVANAIPLDVQKQIRFLATTRNLALHGDSAKVAEAASKLPAARRAFEKIRQALDPSAPRLTFWRRLRQFLDVPGRIKRRFGRLPGMSFVRVLKIVDRVEYLLVRYYRAQGVGLHDKLTSVADRVPEEIERKIRFIAAIRNNAAHEDITLADEKIDAVKKAFAEVLPTLDKGATARKVAYALAALALAAGAAFVAFQILR